MAGDIAVELLLARGDAELVACKTGSDDFKQVFATIMKIRLMTSYAPPPHSSVPHTLNYRDSCQTHRMKKSLND